jgi:antitoxin MazE
MNEGDQIDIRIVTDRTFEVRQDRGRQDALARLRKLRRPLPPGFVFDRDEANARWQRSSTRTGSPQQFF